MNNFIRVVLEHFGVSIKEGLNETITSAPHPGSLFHISAILELYGVESKGVRVLDPNKVDNSYCPFVTSINNKWALITQMSTDSISYLTANSDNIELSISRNDFTSQWDKLALLLTHNDTPYSKKTIGISKRQLSIAAILALLIITIYNVTFNLADWLISSSILLFLSAVGASANFLLLQKHMHKSNKIADAICGISKRTNCDDVINSAGGTIFGVRLSEIGFGYFLTNFVSIILFPKSSSLVWLISIASLPITLWSLWYQAYRVHSWCVLCLLTTCTIWAQSVFGVTSIRLEICLIFHLMNIFSGYTIAVIGIHFLMVNITKSNENISYHRKLNELLSDDWVREHFIPRQAQYAISDENCSALVFGNKSAQRSITIFMNPYCGPCASLHASLQEFSLDAVNIRYVLTSFSEDRNVINKAFIAAYQQLGDDFTWELFSLWFSKGRDQGLSFFAKYQLDTDTADVQSEYNKQTSWPLDKDISGTPTIFCNDRKLSWPYTIYDYILIPK